MPSNELILLPTLKAHRGDRGGLVLTQKYIDGAAEFAKSWPGPVTTLVEVSDQPTSDMDHVEVLPGEIETGLEVRPKSNAELANRLSNAALGIAYLWRGEASTAKLCRKIGVPLAFTSEYTPQTERQIVDVAVSNPIIRYRRKHWLKQAEKSCLKALQTAAGLQCSGTPTYNIYRHIQPEALLFFDNRVRAADVISEADLEARLRRMKEGKPLRLVFGGRLIAMKGVRDLPLVARELKRSGVDFTLDIYGTGELETDLKAAIERFELGDRVSLRGAMDFRTGWIPTLKREADLFVCCHPQGDPSSTYPEVMSCGVPIVGYDNEAFSGVVEHSGSGFLTPLNAPAALAQEIARLDGSREELSGASRLGRKFAMKHTFEKTFARRVEHMIKASRLCNGTLP